MKKQRCNALPEPKAATGRSAERWPVRPEMSTLTLEAKEAVRMTAEAKALRKLEKA